MSENKSISALGMDYAENVAKHWPDHPHSYGIVEHLPPSILEMLKDQDEQFLAGWFNAVALVHDMGIKVLVGELVKRTGGVAKEERDIMLTRVGAVVEGLGYVACAEAVSRRSDSDEEDPGD